MTTTTTIRALALLSVAAACASANDPAPTASAPEPPPAPASATPPPTTGGAPPSGTGPFAAQPDESAGLVNVSADLDALLEHGALKGACDRYRAGETDRKTMLLCGKWMFFYEPFGTSGVPAAIAKFLAQNFPDELGLGFSKLGLVPDPSSPDHLPLGLAPTAPMNGSVDAVAFTCASCHFGQLPDGRYAVGAPNHRYEYGTHILTFTLAPTLGMGLGNAADHDPGAVAKVQPIVDRLSNDLSLKAKLGMALLPIASVKQPAMTKDVEAEYASWPRGTMDFLIAPLPVDDGVHIVGKIIGLWGIPRDPEVAASGMSNAMLAWTGDTHSLDDFIRGFATIGGAAAPSDATMRPLAEYIYSLRAPASPSPPDASLVATGEKLFTQKGCTSCHDGPRGSGKRVYTFAEVGTDDTLAKWLDPTLSGEPCCGISLPPGTTLTHGIKSPRMVGMWTLGRFLHDGALSSLEQVLCLEPRPAGAAPLGTQGHTFGCDASEDDRRALVAFLRSH